MTVRVEWARYGRPATERLREAIAEAKGGDPLAPATVVVPSNHVGVVARRLLATGALGPACERGAGIAAVDFLTLYRLAELLGATRLAAQGRRPVSTPVIAAALRRSLAAEPGVFEPVADHTSTEETLVAAYKELRDVSPAALRRLATCSERAADVVRLHLDARARLERTFSDEEDLVSAALAQLDAGGDRWELGPVVVYLPQRISLHGAALLRSVGSRAGILVIAGLTGDARADAGVERTVRRVCAAGVGDSDHAAATPAQLLAVSPPTVPPPAVPAVSAERTRIVTTSDADEEVRAGIRAVVDAARAGMPLERMAILYGAHEPYGRIVHEQLDLAGIPHNGASVVPLTARVPGRSLLGLLSLPTHGFRRDDVFAWLSSARILHEGRPAPVAAWEKVSREAGVVAGRAEWDRLLDAYAEERESAAEGQAAALDAPEWKATSLRRTASRARDLRRFVLGLIDDLSRADDTAGGWGERARWAHRHLATLLGDERHRAGWPLVERKAFDRTERALDRLARLDHVEDHVGLDVFARTLELELAADPGRVGRMGEGVAVGSVGMGVGLALDLLVVLGLAEGTFPAPVRDDSLLPDDERTAAGGELPLRAEGIEWQHHELLAALAAAERHVLCVPRGDLRRSSGSVASRWVVDVASALGGEQLVAEDLSFGARPWLEHVASYDAGLRAAAFPATAQEHRLRALLAGRRPDAAGDDILAAGSEAVAARRSRRFTRFDGNLAGLAIPSPAGRVTSATRLESWAACPFAYFLGQVLGIEPVEDPEARLRISPLDLGSLVHEVLERFVREVLARPPRDRPGAGDPWTEEDRRRMLEIAEDVCSRYETHGLVGRAIFWRRDKRRIIAELVRFLGEDSSYRAQHRTRPAAVELAFGMPGSDIPDVGLPLPDGRSVSFRGRADRLDVAEDGTLHVVDYKTGKADDFRHLSEDDPDLGGRKLQLVVYGLAARLHAGCPAAAVRADYWFTSARGGFRRVGYPVTDAVLARVATTVQQIVEGIERGVFPHFPGAKSTAPAVECRYCDPDGLGVVDLRRQLDRKREDPALAPYLERAERIGEAPAMEGRVPGAPVAAPEQGPEEPPDA